MKPIVLNMENFLKPNVDLMKRKDNMNNKDFSSILESKGVEIHKDTSKKVLSETKSQLANDSTKNNEISNSEKEDFITTEVEEEIQDSETNVEDYFPNLINYSFDIQDSEIAHEEVDLFEVDIDLEDKIVSAELDYDLESSLLLGSNDGIVDTEMTNHISFSENIQVEVDAKHTSKETDNELPVDAGNYKLDFKQGELAGDSQGVLVKEIPEEDSFKLSNLDTELEESNINVFPQENKANAIKTDSESLDGEQSFHEEKAENHGTSFPVMDKNGIDFTEKAPVEIESNENVNPKEIVQQIIDKFNVDLSKAKNEIRVKLHPESLGDMTMTIEVVKDTVIAKVMVDNARTKEIIEANLFQLKEGIKDTGLEIKTFEVFVGNNNDFDKHSSGQFNFNQNQRKVKIKPESKKGVLIYEETHDDSSIRQVDSYYETNLNLFA